MAPPLKVRGYYFDQTADGALAIEEDSPYEGFVTVTWRPSSDYPGKSAEAVIPQAQFVTVAKQYFDQIKKNNDLGSAKID